MMHVILEVDALQDDLANQQRREVIPGVASSFSERRAMGKLLLWRSNVKHKPIVARSSGLSMRAVLMATVTACFP